MHLAPLRLALGVLIGGTAFAAPVTFSDNNPADVWLNFLNQSYTGTFDLASEGYIPSQYVLNSAIATFTFFDLVGSESFTVAFEAASFLSQGSFRGFLTLDGPVTGAALMDLNADGVLKYTVARGTGEFWLTNANLTIEATRLPDASNTLVLLGLGLAGIGAIRRRVRRA